MKIEFPALDEAFALAHKSMREKRWPEARALWQVYRERYPKHPAPWTQGAICCMYLGDMPDAKAILSQARQRYAKHASVWLVSAELAKLQSNRKHETEYLTAGLEHCPGNWELLFRSADLQMRIGNLQQAQAFNDSARLVAGQRIDLMLQHAELAESSEDWKEAEARWLDLIEFKPDNKAAYTRLAAVLTRQGRTQDARRYRLAGQYGKDLLLPTAESTNTVMLGKGEKGGIHFAQLVMTKALLDLKSESSRNHLNYAWVLIEPLLHLLIYYFLFGQLLSVGIENYGLFLLCGLVPWMWFAKAISTSATSILGGQSLMLTTNISPAFFPLVSVVQSSFKQLPALLFLLSLGLATDPKTLSWSLSWLPIILLIQLLLTTALALLIAAIIPFVRDLANLVGTGLMMLMFLSGVIFNYQLMPGHIAQLLDYNPMAVMISAYRQVILDGNAPDYAGLCYVLLVAVGLFVFCGMFYRKQRRNFARQGMR